MLTGEAAEMAKGSTGLNDEELAKLHPGFEKLFKNAPNILQYQTVAEVVQSEHCFAQVQVGDNLVFDPFLNPEKSKGIMCARALLPIMVQMNSIMEMMSEWAESGKDELPEMLFRTVRCLDPGFEVGGIGGVVYKIRMEKMEA